MRKRMNITKGQRIRLRGREFEFFNAVPAKNASEDTPHDLQFRDVQDHRIEVMTQADFDQLYAEGQVIWDNASQRPGTEPPAEPCEQGDNCEGCPRCRKLRRNRALQGLMKTFDDAPVAKTDKALQSFLNTQSVHWPEGIGEMPKAAVFRRMLRNCGEAGDRRLIYIVDRRRKGARKPRIHPVAEQVLWEKSEEYWTDRTCSANERRSAAKRRSALAALAGGEAGLVAQHIPQRGGPRLGTRRATKRGRARFGHGPCTQDGKRGQPWVGQQSARQLECGHIR